MQPTCQRPLSPTTCAVARKLGHFALLVGLLAPATATAHMGRTKFVQAQPDATGADVFVELSAVNAAFGLGLGTRASDSELITNAEVLSTWLAARLILLTDSGVCVNEPGGLRVVAAKGSQQRMLQIGLRSTCPAPGTNLRLRDESLREQTDHETVVAFGSGDQRQAQILRDADTEVPLTYSLSVAAVMGSFIQEGVIHLITGYDHLLFLLSLILAAGLLGIREGKKAALRSTAVLVTAFTLGHSITLIAAALQVFTLPIEPVEATIALSIVFVAILNIVRPSFHAARPWLAFAFGLIHGFGLSSVLGDVGLPTANRVVALLSFNVGIEFGQLVFVSVLLMPLIWMARRSWYRPVVMTGGSAVVAGFGLVWFAERTMLF